ncbi:patatin-like phospholipase family protein [Brevifollis gellanilyticus]|uniref:PNPLA domain-containing protein n=1 Tax=Brevifollis gellanilyticus TaxID=748831 RepID=A0A512M5X7_9BACT|nr:patatin-like phospholipase family protein [Brevifollis gellanilyticus]GEP42137.1 hypothetical protein BGE01nite_14280 [Brevifollis gellanilyticus]
MSSRIAISLGASFLGYATHSGFLARLHELGIRPVAVGGSSAGAVAAGFYASGLPADQVRQVVTSWDFRSAFIRRTPWFTHYIRATFWESNPGLFKTDDAVTFLESVLGDLQIESLTSPSFLAAVSNLETYRTHFLQSGSLARAMVASCCVPTIFQPLQHAGMTCYDGGVAHETPMDPWFEDENVDTIILHRVSHTGGSAPRMVPFNLINLTASSHAVASEQLLHYRLKLAEMHGKKVIVINTSHDRPALFSSKQMPSFYEAGAATAEKLFESDLKSLR